MKPVRLIFSLLLSLVVLCAFNPIAWAFCGFYVSKADAKLYNNASQVVIARDGDRTILTMANDFQGDVKDFAIVIPVPTILKQDQVRVGDAQIIERLDSFSAPRLVEYFDADPCAPVYPMMESMRAAPSANGVMDAMKTRKDTYLGVTIEEKFTVGEYDILILSAKESGGLETWLLENGYRIPPGARQVLQAYIRQNLKFFVAKVNLEELAKSDTQYLRPLMMAFESKRFMLPIRLGMVNAKGDQDLLVYILSPRGQAEVTNYRMVNIPSDAEIPEFVKNEFGGFYKAMFQTAHRREDKRVAFLEYAWDMSSCDPCSAQPLTPEELTKAGVFWLNSPVPMPLNSSFNSIRDRRISVPSRGNVFITRIHVRYNRDKFPEDLIFQETSNQQQFQGRYIMRHAFKGEAKCEAGQAYRRSLPQRFEKEAQTLAQLTDWKIADIRRRLPVVDVPRNPIQQFWQNIWR
ncbi:hypothetical protein Syn7502_00069 [Synechococcus sp. PCC 7502]|uniref:DUF2330 domain-containing protein n=1 Tax=Synechococcus sp. PCC 7502 TaxID=1173263 RepID=UPI00029FB02E|nr:DUF2330 domain-containing protein [Synechococcus sp. PCC 7502]AFY72243.1 hypothetical protein Syn7502_00069 [Synechococcus sp. PCC 7502]